LPKQRFRMVFSSITFLFYFLPAFLLCYFLLPWKNTVVLAGSLLFYAWGEPRYVPLLLFSAALNYSCGYAISRHASYGKAILYGGIAVNLGLLAYYKYMGFFASVVNYLVSPLGKTFAMPTILLPLGISFFTFQGISYLIDVYRRDVNAQKSFLNFAMYKTMFPQLIAGPIVRYRDIVDEIEKRTTRNADVLQGINLFVIGLSQKVLIANTVAVPADRIFSIDPAQLSPASAWIGVACYSIQIFYDFAGYSNMAIGIGHILGFSYPLNFNRPYSATSITEFWRRWHMSLTSWFRDYLYIPLGGNRLSPLRTYFNLSLVFLLCGLWHGASWTFIIWGAWHGALLVLERMGLGTLLTRIPGYCAHVYTLLMVMIGWVFFRAHDATYALHFLGVMFGLSSAGPDAVPWQMNFDAAAACALVVGTLLAAWRIREGHGTWREFLVARTETGVGAFARSSLQTMLCLLGFALCIASLAAGTYNPFIYFRF
jgi:alginate O-acetyltransferase complex protein AlgI